MHTCNDTSTAVGGLTPNEKIEKAFEDTILEHQMLRLGTAQLTRLHNRGKKRMNSRGLLIGGESRSGKSTLFRKYISMYPPVTVADLDSDKACVKTLSAQQIEIVRYATLKRVIMIELKVRPSRRSIAADILQQLTGTAPRDKQYSPAMLGLIKEYGIEMGTELLLIDEVHHAISSGNEESTEVLSEFYKSLQNIAPFQIAYAGLPKLLQLEKFSQFKERLEPTFFLTPYDWTKKSGRVEFCTLLAKFDQLLRLPTHSGLAAHEFAKRMYVASQGEVGKVSKLLSAALVFAHERNLQKLDLNLLAEVFELFAPSDGREDLEENIDFDAPFDLAAQSHSFSRIATDDNPFLCGDKRLRALWLTSVKLRSAQALRPSSRKTRLEATGPKPPAPF